MEATAQLQQSNTSNGSHEASKTSGECCNKNTSEKLAGAPAKKRKLPPEEPSPSKSHNGSADPLVCEWKSCGSGFNETSVFNFLQSLLLALLRFLILIWQTLGSHVVENHIKSQNSLNSYGFKCEWNGCKVNRKSFRDSWNLIVHVRYEVCPFVVALSLLLRKFISLDTSTLVNALGVAVVVERASWSSITCADTPSRCTSWTTTRKTWAEEEKGCTPAAAAKSISLGTRAICGCACRAWRSAWCRRCRTRTRAARVAPMTLAAARPHHRAVPKRSAPPLMMTTRAAAAPAARASAFPCLPPRTLL